jgi:outer membrane immunogenic protein
MRILAISALALAAVATPAFAQDADKGFTGFHIEAVGGLDHVVVSGVTDDGAAFGVSGGYDFQASSLVVGVEGEASLASTEECEGDECVKAGRDLYIGGRVGLPVQGNKALIYVKAGYTNAQVRATVDDETVGRENFSGVRGGVGIESNVGQFLIRAEYRYSNYEQDLERHQVLAGLGIRF